MDVRKKGRDKDKREFLWNILFIQQGFVVYGVQEVNLSDLKVQFLVVYQNFLINGWLNFFQNISCNYFMERGDGFYLE